MRITLKISGTLRLRFPDYDLHQGLDLEIAEGSNVSDLFTALGISASDGATVIADGKVLRAEEKLPIGVTINLLPIMSGG